MIFFSLKDLMWAEQKLAPTMFWFIWIRWAPHQSSCKKIQIVSYLGNELRHFWRHHLHTKNLSILTLVPVNILLSSIYNFIWDYENKWLVIYNIGMWIFLGPPESNKFSIKGADLCAQVILQILHTRRKQPLGLANCYINIPGDINGKESTCQCRRLKRQGFDPQVRNIP